MGLIRNELGGAGRSLRRTRALWEITSVNINGPPVIILGGYASVRQLYATAQLELEEAGCRSYIFEVGGKFTDSCERLADFLASTEFNGDERVTLVGHSLGGGIAAYMLLWETTRRFVKSVHLLGTPLFGTPIVPLERLIRMTAHVSRDTFVHYRRRFVQFSDYVTAYVGDNDGVAPREWCVVPESAMRVVELPNRVHLDFLNDPYVWQLVASAAHATIRGPVPSGTGPH